MTTNDSAWRILVVDDEPGYLDLIHDMLCDRYTVSTAGDGEEALALVEGGLCPDLVVSDIEMPRLDGYGLLARLRQRPATGATPVIFLTSHNSPADETAGLAAGAADFISRPVNVSVLLARVGTQLKLLATTRSLQQQAAALEAQVRERTAQIERRAEEVRIAQESTIFALTSLAETRDNETGMHIRRVERYVRALVEVLKDDPHYAAELADPQGRDWLAKAAPLHDIGKVGIPDAILLKPGKLNAEEWEVMRQHPAIGERALVASTADVEAPGGQGGLADGGSRFMRYAREIAGAHHEKWDGSGYPRGLAGEAIPLAARLMAVADVYDALISRRPYKDPLPHAVAVDMICEQGGRHFDPAVIAAFRRCAPEFARAADELPDDEMPPRQLEAG